MRQITPFDPSLATSGTFDPKLANPCGRIVLFNESIYGLKLTFEDGSNAALPPWYFRSYVMPVKGLVKWEQQYTLDSSGSPASLVVGESYEREEAVKLHFSEGPLSRLSNIGNTVNTNTATNQVINDDNPTPSIVLEARQFGNASGSNAIIYNDGGFLHAQFVSSVYTKLVELIVGASPLLKLGKGLTLQMPDNAGANFSNIFGIDGGSRTFLQAQTTGNQIAFYNKDGNNILTADGVNKTLNITGSTQSVNGDNGGTASVIEGIIGPFKMALYQQNNYRQAGAGQNITLKAPFTFGAILANMGAGGVQFKQAGAAQTLQIVTTIAVGGGTSTGASAINTASIGWLVTNFNQIADGGAMGSARSGLVLAIGL